MKDSPEKPVFEPIADMYKRLKEERERIVPTLGEDCGWPPFEHVYDKPTDLKLLMAQTVQAKGFNVLIQPQIMQHKLGGFYLNARMNIWVDKDARNWLNQIKSCPEVTAVSHSLTGLKPEMDKCRWGNEENKKVELFFWEKEREHLEIAINDRSSDVEKAKVLEKQKIANARIKELVGDGAMPTIDEIRTLVVDAVGKELSAGKNPDYWS